MAEDTKNKMRRQQKLAQTVMPQEEMVAPLEQGQVDLIEPEQKKEANPKQESKGLSDTFTAALANFLPMVVGGLFEGSEGAVAAYKGSQEGMNMMQKRDLDERGMRVREQQPEIQREVAKMRLNDPLRRAQIELGERRADIADRNLELRDEQLELMRTGETRRGERQAVDLGEKPVVRFESAPEIKSARGTITATKNAEALIDRALENPMAAGALPTQLARLAGQVGVLTDRDVAVFGDAGSIANRLKQIASNMATGTLTQENADFMRDLAKTMRQNSENIISEEADRYSNQYGAILGKDPTQLKQFLLTGLPKEQSSNSPIQNTPSQTKPQGNNPLNNLSLEQRRSRIEELRRKAGR